jgi:hypothetical protein
MKIISTKLMLFIITVFSFYSCSKNDQPDGTTGIYKLLIGTNITSSNPIIGYIGTMKDLTDSNFTNARSRQTIEYPYVTLYKNNVFVMPHRVGDVVRKFTRMPDGLLAEAGSLTAPAASSPLGAIIENDSRGFISLFKAGKILVFNPTTMNVTDTINLASYGLGDSNPDPNVMAFRNGKLYVACSQTTNGYTSSYPVQILIIDANNNFSIESVTDNRSAWAGSINEQKSMFFDEAGDLYLFCVASYGFIPGQKSGFLRIKNGQTSFDPTYFFNVSDYSITGIPGNKVDYLQRMRYAGNGIVYSTGNIYSLASNPPNYVNDRTYGSFKVDIANKTITKLGIPYSNGYAASVGLFENKVLFGIAGTNGVGIYRYDPAKDTSSSKPIVNTQGDPHQVEAFE